MAAHHGGAGPSHGHLRRLHFLQPRQGQADRGGAAVGDPDARKPWYRRRALRLFRDDTSLSATPHLWPTIEQALAESRFLIVLASPGAAASQWVNKEVAWWLDHKSIDTLLTALTDGELAWDNALGDFPWPDGVPLPPVLTGRCPTEPKWVDLRAYRAGADPRDVRFLEAGADLAAAIHGLPKEDLLSQEARQQRRALTLAWSAAGSLLILAGLAGWQWKTAIDAERLADAQKQIAQQQRDRAVEAENVAVEQRKEAQTQRDRAEKALAAATTTANTLVNDLALDFRERSGMPIDLVRKILDRARGLQRQLTQSGEVTADLRFSETSALMELTMTLLAQSDTKAAIQAATEAREIAEGRVAANPNDEVWQRELSMTYGRLGLALSDAAELQPSLAAFRKALAIREKLAAAHPEDSGARRDLAIAHGELADAQRNGDVNQALQSYRTSLAIFEPFTAMSPDKAGPQRDLSLILTRMGTTLEEIGRHGEAEQTYRRALALTERLAEADPGDTQAKRDLSRNYRMLGSLLHQLGNYREALEIRLKDLRLMDRLAASDTGNAEWQRDLAVSYEHVGHALMANAQPDDAFVHHRKSLALREKLVGAEPGRLAARSCGQLHQRG